MNAETLSAIVGAIPLTNVLGIAALGVIAAICVTGVAYGLTVGQTGSIETIQNPQGTPVESTTPTEQPGQVRGVAQAEEAAQDREFAQGEETDPNETTSQDQQTTPPEVPAAQIDAGTIGVVSNSQGLGILATIASAAVGGIAGLLVGRGRE